MGIISEDFFSELMTEESEFAGKDTPASNNPTKNWDASLSKEMNVSVPGGLSEKPTAKPYDGEHGPTPTGLTEKPNSGWPEVSIPVPSSELLKDPTYNKGLQMLQKSFESVSIALQMMQQITEQAQGNNAEVAQQSYNESVLCEALVTALEDGPLFESLERDDKGKVKALVRKMRPRLEKLNNVGIKFYKPAKWIRFVWGPGGKEVGGTKGDSTEFRNWFNTRLWSIVGAVLIDSGHANEFAAELNEKFASELGPYKFLMVRVPLTISDVFRTKFGWKNSKHSYFVIIDKKLDSQIKKAIAAMRPAEDDDDEEMDESAKECDCGECPDCKKKAKEEKDKKKKGKEEDDDNEDLKVESAIDDFFAEGVGSAVANAVKQTAYKMPGRAAALAAGTIAVVLIEKHANKMKAIFNKYKAAKKNRDFGSMRSAKEQLKAKTNELASAISSEAEKSSKKDGGSKVPDSYYEDLLKKIRENADLKEILKLGGFDADGATAADLRKWANTYGK